MAILKVNGKDYQVNESIIIGDNNELIVDGESIEYKSTKVYINNKLHYLNSSQISFEEVCLIASMSSDSLVAVHYNDNYGIILYKGESIKVINGTLISCSPRP